MPDWQFSFIHQRVGGRSLEAVCNSCEQSLLARGLNIIVDKRLLQRRLAELEKKSLATNGKGKTFYEEVIKKILQCMKLTIFVIKVKLAPSLLYRFSLTHY